MTVKEKRQAIIDKYEAIPNRQISAGVYLGKVGTKYIHIINTWEKTTSEKILIDDFDL